MIVGTGQIVGMVVETEGIIEEVVGILVGILDVVVGTDGIIESADFLSWPSKISISVPLYTASGGRGGNIEFCNAISGLAFPVC